MPSSPFQQLTQIVEIIRVLNPSSVLDVGIGFGKYGVLAREYLDVNSGHLRPTEWQRRIDGIEAFRSYLSPLHEYIYDHVYVGDAREVIKHLNIRYDLILLIDMLEHFDRDQGLSFLSDLTTIGRNVLVSTPGGYVEQGPLFGNQFEEHHSGWHKRDFSDFKPHCFIPNEFSLICLIGDGVPLLNARVLSLPKRIKRNFPYLLPLKRGVEQLLLKNPGPYNPRNSS